MLLPLPGLLGGFTWLAFKGSDRWTDDFQSWPDYSWFEAQDITASSTRWTDDFEEGESW